MRQLSLIAESIYNNQTFEVFFRYALTLGISRSDFLMQILSNLNLSIKRQEILGMLGPNGVGKSTIFNLITGLKDPNYGEVIIDGINVTNLPINERFTKFRLGLVPQYGGLIHDLTMEDNLKLVAEIHIKEKGLREQKINKLISQFEFEALLNIDGSPPPLQCANAGSCEERK